jgi:SAM-dependent methyltransferase
VNNPDNAWNTYEQALQSLSGSSTTLDAPDLVLRLRKAFPNADVRELNLAVETYIARRQAPEKLGEWAKEGHFSVSLLQQASRQSIASYRAGVFRGCSHVLEIGTGTGSDTAALARLVGHVTTIDGDPIASALAQRNLALQGITNVTFLVGDAQTLVPTLTETFDGVYADPARRTRSGERIKSGEDYSPPLSFLLGLEIGSLRAIKISPGLFVEPCPTGWIRQFVGFDEECLEQTLWYGSTLKDSSVVVTDRSASWEPPTETESPPMAESLQGYLVEAHGTLNRCQRLEAFFHENGIYPIATDVAYGITPTQPAPSPLYTAYRVLEDLPFSKKRLREVLLQRGWSSRTEFKKRNFPGEIEQVRADLNLPKHTHTSPFGVVFLFRYHGKPWTVVAERLSPSAQ